MRCQDASSHRDHSRGRTDRPPWRMGLLRRRTTGHAPSVDRHRGHRARAAGAPPATSRRDGDDHLDQRRRGSLPFRLAFGTARLVGRRGGATLRDLVRPPARALAALDLLVLALAPRALHTTWWHHEPPSRIAFRSATVKSGPPAGSSIGFN